MLERCSRYPWPGNIRELAHVIEQALTASGGNVSETARKLGMGREALRYRLQKYAIVHSSIG